MSHTPFHRVRAKRVLEVSETPDELDFDSVSDTAEADTRLGTLQRGLAALAVSALGLLTLGGVAVAASPASDKVDVTATSTDKTSVDITRAVPAPDVLTGQQQAAGRATTTRQSATGTNGSLAAFTGSTTTSRSAERTELSTAVAAQDATTRQAGLSAAQQKVTAAAAEANASARSESITVDMTRVKAEQARIAAQIKADQAKLKAAQKAAAAAAAKKASTAGSTTTPATTTTSTAGTTATPPTTTTSTAASVTAGGGTTPIASGSYSLGAHFGEYGSCARWHTGQDFPAPVGTPVRAVADGVASDQCAGCQGWAGDAVMIIHHADGSSTLYAHLDHDAVAPGTVVKAGQVIGYVGMKGRTFGPHLHFEFYPKGTTPGDVYKATDPLAFLLSLGVHA